MSEAPIHINRGVNRLYVCRVREPGRKRWLVLKDEYGTEFAAIDALAAAFRNKSWKRGEVLLTMDCYDPIVVVRMSR